MFFILSKTLQYAFSPLTWVVLALVVARLTKNHSVSGSELLFHRSGMVLLF